jgi:hypothetical protein
LCASFAVSSSALVASFTASSSGSTPRHGALISRLSLHCTRYSMIVRILRRQREGNLVGLASPQLHAWSRSW